MSYCVIGGLVVGVWAMLSIVGNEHVRRTQELERKYAKPKPAPPADPIELTE